jgi:hypothetical protein
MKFLFFSPHAELWVHAFPEALIAEMLGKAGHHVAYIGCGGQLDRFCVPMASHGMTTQTPAADRAKICQQCQTRDTLIRKSFGLEGPHLSDLVDEQSVDEADAILSNADRHSLIDLEIDGIQLGKIALYQLMLRKKRIETDLSDDEIGEYLVELRNTIYAWQAGKKLLDREMPDRVVVYNALYSVNRVVCKLAERRGIPHYFLHAGGNLFNRLQTLWIGRGDTFSFFPHLLRKWPDFADIACDPDDLRLITEHYLELLRGRSTFVYSSPKSAGYVDVRKLFGVKPSQKLLVATLGSYDEERAAEVVGARIHLTQPLFPTQIEWVQSLLSYAQRRPDIFLVLRVHPREFPNKREGMLSHHAQQLRLVFADLPANVAVNWPDDKLSMYDLADQTDVFLNSWSTVGKEMALLGIPVVLYAPELAFYPADLGYSGTTVSSYFSAIEKALADGWSFERVRRAYRWYVFEFIRAAVFLGDSFPKREGFRRGVRQRLIEQIDRRFVPGFEQRWDCSRRDASAATVDQVLALFETGASSVVDLINPQRSDGRADESESAALAREAVRLANALFPGRDARTTSRLYRALCGSPVSTKAVAG